MLGVRLRAQPLRSDMNLSDTGAIKVSGEWQRAHSLYDTPMQFGMQWDGAQLGQLSKFLSGKDRGWRGTARTSLEFSGTPGICWCDLTGCCQDFRRYDIAGTSPLDLRESL